MTLRYDWTLLPILLAGVATMLAHSWLVVPLFPLAILAGKHSATRKFSDRGTHV